MLESLLVFSPTRLPRDLPMLGMLIIMPLNPLPAPTPFLLVTASPFLDSVSLLLFCSFSLASLLSSPSEGNHLVLVFLCLAYFTEHNTLWLHPR